MIISLAYGKGRIELDLPPVWDVTVVEPAYTPALDDAHAALCSALDAPLGSEPLQRLARKSDRVGIIVNDITRATPTPAILRAVLGKLEHIPPQQVTIYNALGTHRENSADELRRMLGDEFCAGYRIVQNDCLNRAAQMYLGHTSRGNPVWLNHELMQCDLKVLTGFIEPHFFAGFSGGGKAIMPGMAGLETILGNHCAANIGDKHATWGVTHGNPIFEEVREVAAMAGRTFLLNVTLNREKAITGVYAGDLISAHDTGCAAVKRQAMVAVDRPFDIVLTSNSGYPLDLNLYQTVKGMSAAALVVRRGGAILAAAECWDGIPDHGLFGQLLREAPDAQTLLETICAPGYRKQDQWQAQILAQILLKADVHVYAGGLSPVQLKAAKVKPSASLMTTLQELTKRYGPRARICVLPEGPLTIPYVNA
jgi:nickel-dependent lactate racemase